MENTRRKLLTNPYHLKIMDHPSSNSPIVVSLIDGAAENLDGINRLLRRIHSESSQLTVIDLADHMVRSVIALAKKDNRIVGLAVLTTSYVLTHVEARIRSLVVFPEHDEAEGMLVTFLHNYARTKNYKLLLIEVEPEKERLLQILTFLFFEVRTKVSLRLKLWKLRDRTP